MNERPPWTAWAAIALAAVYVLLAGPYRSPFSGVPLSGKATYVFGLLVVLAVFVGLFRPRRTVHAGWLIALAAAIVVKIALAPLLVWSGWRGEYSFAQHATVKPLTFLPMQRAWFQSRGAAALPYRIDPRIDFREPLFGLSFLNEVAFTEYTPAKRGTLYPMHIRWSGFIDVAEPHAAPFTLSAAGRAAVMLDGKRVADSSALQLPAGRHVITVVYDKPTGVRPEIHFLLNEPVTPAPATPAELLRSAHAARAIDLLGGLVLLLLAIALYRANRPLRRLFLEDVWLQRDRVVAVVLIACFILGGIAATVPERHLTHEEGMGDDPLDYETFARQIAHNGVLMVNDQGKGEPYYFYPFYPYAVAVAHIVFGDDFANIVLFNDFCLAAMILALWWLLRGRLSDGAAALALLAGGYFTDQYVRPYAHDAFTDNLFLPAVLGMLGLAVVALERRSAAWLLATGVAAGLAAAVRPSLLTMIVFMPLALLFYGELGNVRRRIACGVSFVAGFAAGVAPFTIRNWIVSKMFVLLASSTNSLPYWLTGKPYWIDGGVAPTTMQSLREVLRLLTTRPFFYGWVILKKALFTLGFTSILGVTGGEWFFIATLLFVLALWRGRIPRPVAVAILAFAVSHLAAMMIAIPNTYGYKTILPFIMSMMVGAVFLLPHAGRVRIAAASLPTQASVVIPTATTPEFVDALKATGIVRDVIIADEPYGAAVRRGLAESSSDWIIFCDGDGTFAAADVARLLPFGDQAGLVIGMRKSDQPVAELRRQWLFARLLSAGRFADIGCGMWMIEARAGRLIAEQLRSSGRGAIPEVIARALKLGLRVVQVPVRVVPRSAGSQPAGAPAPPPAS